jgi:hypothetical protein
MNRSYLSGGSACNSKIKWNPAWDKVWDAQAYHINIPAKDSVKLKNNIGSRIPTDDDIGGYWVAGRDSNGNYIPKRDTLAGSESRSIRVDSDGERRRRHRRRKSRRKSSGKSRRKSSGKSRRKPKRRKTRRRRRRR